MTDVMAEPQLIAQVRMGNPEAVRQWFTQFQGPVLKYVLGKIASASDAEEITQEVFINALRQLPLFQGNSSLLTWMISIARHEVADYYRKKYAKKVLQLVPLEVSFHQGVELSEIDAIEIVQEVLQELAPTQQEILLMKYIDGKSVAEIAQELKRTIKAVEAELFRARRDFRELYLTHAQTS